MSEAREPKTNSSPFQCSDWQRIDVKIINQREPSVDWKWQRKPPTCLKMEVLVISALKSTMWTWSQHGIALNPFTQSAVDLGAEKRTAWATMGRESTTKKILIKQNKLIKTTHPHPHTEPVSNMGSDQSSYFLLSGENWVSNKRSQLSL